MHVHREKSTVALNTPDRLLTPPTRMGVPQMTQQNLEIFQPNDTWNFHDVTKQSNLQHRSKRSRGLDVPAHGADAAAVSLWNISVRNDKSVLAPRFDRWFIVLELCSGMSPAAIGVPIEDATSIHSRWQYLPVY
jgi:hypothetical protein